MDTKSLVNSVKLKDLNTKVFPWLKVVSTLLIASAIGLELWNLYAVLTTHQGLRNFQLIFGIERLAITIHLVEAVIAASYAPSRKKRPIEYGIYTFLVGTVGLIELLAPEND